MLTNVRLLKYAYSTVRVMARCRIRSKEPAISSVTAEYLETIYNVMMEGDPVIAAGLARKFNVSAPNVAAILQRMEQDGLVQRDHRKVINLTDAGKSRAEAALR